MYRLKSVLCALLLTVLLLSPATSRAERETGGLLVLTSAATETEAVLRELMLYRNLRATYADAAEPTDPSGYEGVIVAVGEGGALSAQTADAILAAELPVFVIGEGGLSLLTDTAELTGSVTLRLTADDGSTDDSLIGGSGLTVTVGEGEALGGTVFVGTRQESLCRTTGNVTHLAWFDPASEDLCELLSDCLQLWQWPYTNVPTAYGRYVVLDEVYPFEDPALLMELTDMLEEEQVPYAVCAMPLYANAEYPSFKRFCEYLRYVQSRGVPVILHTPLVALADTDAGDVREHIDTAYEAYAAYGVYPVALEAPESWLQSEKGLSVLQGFRTILLFRSEERQAGERLTTNAAIRNGHTLIAPARMGTRLTSSAYAQAIYLDVHEDIDTLRRYVRRLRGTGLKRIAELESSVYVGAHHLTASPQNGYVYDGSSVSLTYMPFDYESDYRYDRGFTAYLTTQIETSNRFILVFVFVGCSIFITAIVLARRLMRRQLLGVGKRRRAPHSDKGGDGT